MYHEHKMRVRFYGPNRIWVIEQPGKDSDIYLYPNGELKYGIFEGHKTLNCTGNTFKEIDVGFE